jgi:hypothetical protein
MPRSSEWPLSFRPFNQHFVLISYRFHARYIPSPSDHPLFDLTNNICLFGEDTNYGAPHYAVLFIPPLKSSYFPKNCILKHPASLLFP